MLGYFIVGLFALSWVVSVAFYKWRRFDDLEAGPRIGLVLPLEPGASRSPQEL